MLGPIVSVLASISASEAIKLLVGEGEINRGLINIDLWDNTFYTFILADRQPDCPACGEGDFHYLDAYAGSRSAVLCGRNAVQVSNSGVEIDLSLIAARLQPLGEVKQNPYLVRAHIDNYEITLFADGRAIIKGTEDADVARSLYARYVGT